MSRRPNHHLLRTLAAVSPASRVVEVGSDDGRHTAPLAQLGFEVWASDRHDAAVRATRERLAGVTDDSYAAEHVSTMAPAALGYPDAYAHWIVITTLPEVEKWRDVIEEARRVLAPGAWLWTETDAPEALVGLAHEVGLVVAEDAASDADGEPAHVVLRRPEERR